MSAIPERPVAVNTAFWILVVGAALLLVGGLMAASVSFDYLRNSVPPTVSDDGVRSYARFYRGAGVLFSLAAVALVAFAARARSRDPRSRRAAMALGLTIVVVVGVVAALGFSTTPSLLSLLPIVVGTLLLSRPAVVEWYAGD
jgi:uncharacterized membrane protein